MMVQNLQVFGNTDNTLTLYARNVNNAVQNLTGLTLNWRVGFSPEDPDNTSPLFTKTGTIVSASAGTFTVAIVADDTEFMRGDYTHDAVTTDGSGNQAVVTTGRFRVIQIVAST